MSYATWSQDRIILLDGNKFKIRKSKFYMYAKSEFAVFMQSGKIHLSQQLNLEIICDRNFVTSGSF